MSELVSIFLLVCLCMGGDCLGGVDPCQILSIAIHAYIHSVACISTV